MRENDMEMRAKAKGGVTGRRTEGGRIRLLRLLHLRMKVTQEKIERKIVESSQDSHQFPKQTGECDCQILIR